MATSPPNFLDDSLPVPARLAIFGKHPTAADHLEDIGLVSSSLLGFKLGFYVEGIGDCLSRQAWLKDLGSCDSIPYDHNLLCVGRKGWLAVRFQQSSDAPGRKQFPLVLALHGNDFSALNRVAEIGQLLDAQIAAASLAKDSATLAQIHSQAQLQLQELVKSGATSPPPTRSARQAWLQSLSLTPDGEALPRICHAVSPQGAGAGKARVPLHTGGPWQSAALWLSLARKLLDSPSNVLTVVWKQRQSLADLALTPPGSRVLAGIFAPENTQPLTAIVPFTVSPELKAHTKAAVQIWLEDVTLFPEDGNAGTSQSLLTKVCNGLRGWVKPNV